MNIARLAEMRQSRGTDSLHSAEIFRLPLPTADFHSPDRLAKNGERVVQLGSGAALDTLALGHAVGPKGRVDAVESDWSLYTQARENLSLAAPTNVELHHGPLDDLPLPDGAFDRVIANAIWIDTRAPMVVLAEAARVLTPGGRLALREWIATGIPHLARNDPPTAAQLREMLEEAGFVDIHIQLDGDQADAGLTPGLVGVTVVAGRKG
jgi:SAM-dependent methyltransferase